MNEGAKENFKFFFKGGNKTVSISVGDSQDLNIQEVLEAVKDIVVAGGFTYVDDIRAVNFGEKYNTYYSSNIEDPMWTKENESYAPVVPKDDVIKQMTYETMKDAEIPVKTDLGLDEYPYEEN